MATHDTFLAIFLGSKSSAENGGLERSLRAGATREDACGRRRLESLGRETSASHRRALGGPLGKTKKISAGGIEEISNALGAFTIVRADSHEAAAKLFENHPHFTHFPGESVEVMPVLPIPGA